MKPRSGSVGGLWAETYLDVAGCSAVGGSEKPAYRTIEVVYRMTSASGRILFCSGANKRYLLFDDSGKKVYFDGSNVKTPCLPFTFAADEDRIVAAVYNANNAVTNVYDDGVSRVGAATHQNNWNAGDGKLMIGDRAANGTTYKWYGRVYAIRLYDRALSADEIRLNADIDSARFFGGVTPDGLLVRGEPGEYGEVSPGYGVTNGLVAGKSVTCTSPEVAQNEYGSEQAVCLGYSILRDREVWLEHTIADGEERSFAYVPPGESAGVLRNELVWHWSEPQVRANALAPMCRP